MHSLPGEENRAGINETLSPRVAFPFASSVLDREQTCVSLQSQGFDIVVNGGFHPQLGLPSMAPAAGARLGT